jgi:hypothetical protein
LQSIITFPIKFLTAECILFFSSMVPHMEKLWIRRRILNRDFDRAICGLWSLNTSFLAPLFSSIKLSKGLTYKLENLYLFTKKSINKNTVAIFLGFVKTQNPHISFQNIIFCSLKLVHWFDCLSVSYDMFDLGPDLRNLNHK